MLIRKSALTDLKDIMKIYHHAQKYMASNGNAEQWGTEYPWEELILQDISLGYSYICEDKERVVGTFYYGPGPEEDYKELKEGQWLEESKPYDVVHRIAADGSVKGIGTFCFQWIKNHSTNVRIDTHANNETMLSLLKKMGFTRTGKIDFPYGGERITFQWVKS